MDPLGELDMCPFKWNTDWIGPWQQDIWRWVLPVDQMWLSVTKIPCSVILAPNEPPRELKGHLQREAEGTAGWLGAPDRVSDQIEERCLCLGQRSCKWKSPVKRRSLKNTPPRSSANHQPESVTPSYKNDSHNNFLPPTFWFLNADSKDVKT